MSTNNPSQKSVVLESSVKPSQGCQIDLIMSLISDIFEKYAHIS